jgi:hypothetical protein
VGHTVSNISSYFSFFYISHNRYSKTG